MTSRPGGSRRTTARRRSLRPAAGGHDGAEALAPLGLFAAGVTVTGVVWALGLRAYLGSLCDTGVGGTDAGARLVTPWTVRCEYALGRAAEFADPVPLAWTLLVLLAGAAVTAVTAALAQRRA